jgi:disulfide bond formation protein DsbB
MLGDTSLFALYDIRMNFEPLRTQRAAPWIALALSGGLLVGAWIFQYGFGYLPCQMCYWQRHAHKAVLALAALWLVLRAIGVEAAEMLRWAVVIALLVSFSLAAWHVGVEYGWLEAPPTCLAGSLDVPDVDLNDPLAFLSEPVKPPACSEAVWHFLGLSMAGWNAALSLIGAIWIATSKLK